LKHTSVAIREVFAELRRTLGQTVPAKELLNFAFIATGFFNANSASEYDNYEFYLNNSDDHNISGYSFEEWPLDYAMNDGGWRVLEYEYIRIKDENMDYGVIMLDAEIPSFQYPEGTLEGDLIISENLDWLTVDKKYGQSTAADGWAVDVIGISFYTPTIDLD
jgi:hypothetical protein